MHLIVAFFHLLACILNTSFTYFCLYLSGIMLFKCFLALCITFISRELNFSKSEGSVVMLELLFEEIQLLTLFIKRSFS